MARPLLMDELNPVEKANLSALKALPGYAVLEKLLMAACRKATEEAIAVNPADDGYLQKLSALQSRARERNEFSLLILQSVEYHTQAEVPEEEEGQSGNRLFQMPKGNRQ
jgi:hypothetical protein